MESVDSEELTLCAELQVSPERAVVAQIKIQYLDRVVDVPVVKNSKFDHCFSRHNCFFKQVC